MWARSLRTKSSSTGSSLPVMTGFPFWSRDWRQGSSDACFRFLGRLQVEFSLMVSKDFHRGLNTLRAKNVTLVRGLRAGFRFSGPWYLPVRQVGGESIALQDELDATEKQFVGGQHLRYTGTLKFYSPRPAIKQLYRHTALHCPVLAVGRHGFGYVMMDEGQHSLPSSFDGMQQTRLRCGS